MSQAFPFRCTYYSSQIQLIGETFEEDSDSQSLFDIELDLPIGHITIPKPCLRFWHWYFVWAFTQIKAFWLRISTIMFWKKFLFTPLVHLIYVVNLTPLECVYSSRSCFKWFAASQGPVFITKQKIKMSVKYWHRAISNFWS